MPALGEVIRTADESFEITRLSYGNSFPGNNSLALKTCLGGITGAIMDEDKQISLNSMALLNQVVRVINEQVNNLISHKKEFALQTDKGVAKDVLMGLKKH